jgi:GT2 family glycosyltransferase
MILPKVWAVVVNWDRRDDTMECLQSLQRQTYGNLDLLVVDNGSKDDSAAAISRDFPGTELVLLPENRGFAGGANAGIRAALDRGADLVCLVNNDTVADPAMMSHLVQGLGPSTGMAAPKIYYSKDPECIWSVGGDRHPLTLEMTNKGTGQRDRGQWNSVLERDYLVGCVLLVRREVFERAGLFDERFFSYYEDLDFCAQVRGAGYGLRLVPQGHVWHKVAQTSGGCDSPRERYSMARGSVLFFRKHVRGWRWVFVIPYRLLSGAKTVARLTLAGKQAAAAAYCRGLWDGCRVPLPRAASFRLSI